MAQREAGVARQKLAKRAKFQRLNGKRRRVLRHAESLMSLSTPEGRIGVYALSAQRTLRALKAIAEQPELLRTPRPGSHVQRDPLGGPALRHPDGTPLGKNR